MKRITILLGLGLLCHASAIAQPSHFASVTTEGLWNTTTGIANWVNILTTDSSFSLPWKTSLSVEFLSINNLRMQQGKSGVADNLHLFSAIEDAPETLSLMTLGLERSFAEGKFMLFAGIRHLGRDYFTSAWNSLFTSAMNALYPTISTNFVVADAPCAAMALHAEWHPTERWSLKASLYDGVASQEWRELFVVNPHRDGVFAIGELSYSGDDNGLWGTYNIGATYGYAPTLAGLENGDHQKVRRASVWMLAEQPIIRGLGDRELCMLLHGAWAPKGDCDLYGGVGILCREFLFEGDYIGIMASRGFYTGGHETQIEMTYAIPYKYGTIQPALHRVHSSVGNFTVGMLKVVVEL